MIVDALAEKGEIDAAKKLFAQITPRPATRDLRSAVFTAAYQIAEHQARGGDSAGALTTAAEIADPYDRFWTFIAVAGQQLYLGDRDAARQTLSLVRPLISSHDGERMDVSVFVSLGRAHVMRRPLSPAHVRAKMAIEAAGLFTDAGDRSSAEELLTIAAEFSRGASQLDGEGQELARQTLTDLGIAHAKTRNFKGAAETAARLSDTSSRAEVEAKIATTQGAAGDFAAALESAKKISAPLHRVSAYVKLAEINRDRAAEILKYAAWLAGTIRDEYSRNQAFVDIAGGQAKAGDFAAAQRAVAAIHIPRDKVNAWIAVSQANASYARRALESGHKLAMMMSQTAGRDSAATEIAAEQARLGDMAAALRSLDLITEHSHRTSAHRRVAFSLARHGHLQPLVRWAESLTDAPLVVAVSLAAADGITTRTQTRGLVN
jgi:hypothetical protein